MPIPSPDKREEQQNFMSRCMINETMRKEFPDNKQRSAVCYSKYRQTKRTKSAENGNPNDFEATSVTWEDALPDIENPFFIDW